MSASIARMFSSGEKADFALIGFILSFNKFATAFAEGGSICTDGWLCLLAQPGARLPSPLMKMARAIAELGDFIFIKYIAFVYYSALQA